DLVWWKRSAYFATLAVTAALLLLPAGLGPLGLHNVGIALAGLVGLAGMFLPSIASPLVAYFQEQPLELIIGGGLIVALMTAGVHLQNTIAGRMRTGWVASQGSGGSGTTGIGQLIAHDVVHAVRTSRLYRAMFLMLSRYVVPSVFGGAVIL